MPEPFFSPLPSLPAMALRSTSFLALMFTPSPRCTSLLLVTVASVRALLRLIRPPAFTWARTWMSSPLPERLSMNTEPFWELTLVPLPRVMTLLRVTSATALADDPSKMPPPDRSVLARMCE